MAKPFKKLVQKMPAASRARVTKRKQALIEEMALQELRQALSLTQTQLAESLKINQAAVSKIESQSDMYVSTLRRVLEAMGARLQIVAEFPDRRVVIDQFSAKRSGTKKRASA
jgi:transcriptional regulator with XRE-family HTH domain